jgi:AcrR family transcriptional regulator
MNTDPWGAVVPSFREQFQLKRQVILRTAAHLIRLRGYEQTSLSDIADELKIAKPTVYHYFRSKGEIVRELLEIGVGRFSDPAIHPEDFPDAPGLSGAEKLERFLRRCVRTLCIETGGCLMTTPPEVLDAESRHQYDLHCRPIDNMGQEIIRSGIADGSFIPCDVPSVYLLIAGAFRYVPKLHFERGVPIASVADSVVQMVMGGLRR